ICLIQGQGIAQVAAQYSGAQSVILQDVSQQSLERAKKLTRKLLDKQVEKEKITKQQADEIYNRIQFTQNLTDLRNAEFVIEAAPENIDLKLKIFKELDQITSPDTILATNTSSISVTKLASVTSKPQNVI